jgi:acetate---CoA ligase (ADP-forming)
MKSMFFPATVAIFGVSDTPTNLARVMVGNMDSFGFRGTIYLVGSKEGKLGERRIYPDVADLPEVPELAVLLVAARHIPETLGKCGQRGIRNIVIETGGFSEFGEERKGLEEEVRKAATRWNMKILGPNCVGTVNLENGLALPFYPLLGAGRKKGNVSIISQSGGLVHDLMTLCQVENVGLSKVVSVGNKLLIDENDMLEYLISDDATGIIGLYLESMNDGRRFMGLAAGTDKPIILVKSNRSPGGTEIARFHTTALAGDDNVVDEAMKQAGVHRVQGIKEMVDCFKAFSLPLLRGPRLATMGRSGGHAVLSADSVLRHGFTLASFSKDFYDVLAGKTKAGVIRMTNPLDLGDVFDLTVHGQAAERALQEEGVDGVVFLHSYSTEDACPTWGFIRNLLACSVKHRKPVILCMIAHKADWCALRESSDLPVFTSIDEALESFAVSLNHARRSVANPLWATPAETEQAGSPLKSSLPSGVVPVSEAFSLLQSYGLAVADYRVVENTDDGFRAASELGYPVALKMASPDILHKTEKGGVLLNIKSPGELEEAFRGMSDETFLVQKMTRPGLEVIIGGRRDPVFGPLVLCGLGGIFVEIYQDVALRVAPVTSKEAREMIDGLKGSRILKGFRGQGAYDVDYLVVAVSEVSRLLTEHREIKTLDINPLILFGIGEGGLAVDVKLQVE